MDDIRPNGVVGTRVGSCPPEAEILDLLGELIAHAKSHLQEVLRPYDLAPPSAMALRLIDTSISMKELGIRVKCDPSFVTAIADSLEERGLARREIDPTDRRIKNLVLTEKGEALRAELERDFFSDLPGIRRLDEHDREVFLGLLRRMVAAEREAAGCAGTEADCAPAAATQALSTQWDGSGGLGAFAAAASISAARAAMRRPA